jgi:AraC-like DNA-binding protein
MFKIVLLLGPVYVTLFWAIILSTYSRKTHLPKKFLGWFMIVAFVVYLSHLFYFEQEFNVYYYLDSLYTLVYLMVYPVSHVYVRLLTVDNNLSFKKHSVHLLAPVIISLLTLAGYIIMDKEEGLNYVATVLKGGSPVTISHLYMKSIYILGRFAFLFQVVLYFYLNFKLIRTNNLKLQDYYSSMENRNLNWVQLFNISLAITSISSISLVILGREVFMLNENYLVFPSVVFTAMLFVVGYLGNSQNSAFTEAVEDTGYIPGTENKTSPALLRSELRRLFEKDKIFQNPDLKIWDVCDIIGTNRTYISKIINNEYGKNFCGFVNHYRVDHAKSMAQENKKLSNEEIAYLSGFGSLKSVNRAFLEIEGVSLREYRERLEDDDFKG